MALSGLDIYKLLPKTNCKDCGFPTCLAFAMALAQKKTVLAKCPHVSAEAKAALESAAEPPIKLVTIGTGESKIEIGNETVMYRHEQKFHHPAGVGILIDDLSDDPAIAKAVSEINKYEFERVGQKISVNLICVANSSKKKERFTAVVKNIAAATKLNLALKSDDAQAMAEAVSFVRDRRPLIICSDSKKTEEFAAIAKDVKCPIAITCISLEEAAELAGLVKKAGIDEIIINLSTPSLSARVQGYTYARRMALKKNFRLLGYPIIAFTGSNDPDLEAAEALTYILKYAGMVIIHNIGKERILPLLVARQDIYQDPQKPVQVEPKIYPIGKVTKDSPVLITTNFSITYFTVAGEVESSKVPSYIVCSNSEGMSVLTAWAAEKFTAESITDTLAKCGIGDLVSHNRVIIPGYVSVLSGKLEEISGWKISVGPREASGITNYLRNWK